MTNICKKKIGTVINILAEKHNVRRMVIVINKIVKKSLLLALV